MVLIRIEIFRKHLKINSLQKSLAFWDNKNSSPRGNALITNFGKNNIAGNRGLLLIKPSSIQFQGN